MLPLSAPMRFLAICKTETADRRLESRRSTFRSRNSEIENGRGGRAAGKLLFLGAYGKNTATGEIQGSYPPLGGATVSGALISLVAEDSKQRCNGNRWISEHSDVSTSPIAQDLSHEGKSGLHGVSPHQEKEEGLQADCRWRTSDGKWYTC